MKKIFLTLAVFTYICTLPSFALKQILNDEKDRIVPSRLMGSYYNPSDKDAAEASFKAPYGRYIKNGVYVIPGYRAEEFEKLYRGLLGRNIRPELAGAYWEYPDYAAYRLKYEQAAAEFKKGFDTGDKKFAKKHEREAADYFYRDTLQDPERIIQSGYDMIEVEE